MRRVAILALTLAATLARAAGDRPRLPREHHDDDRDHEPRRRAPPTPPLRRPVYDTLSLETRDALATAAALAQRAPRARARL